MNEQLRVLSPVLNIPKVTRTPQPLTANGKSAVVPPGTKIALCAAGVHLNERVWPHQVDKNGKSDITEFRPERWISLDAGQKAEAHLDLGGTRSDASSDDGGVDFTPDTAGSLHRPPRGAYIPFSEGPRACLGRRFAQVEILAALAVIFKNSSVELDVPGELETMGEGEKRGAWENEGERIKQKMKNEMGTIITLQLRGSPIGLKVVPRGEETFRYED
jgi:cytochrome P450